MQKTIPTRGNGAVRVEHFDGISRYIYPDGCVTDVCVRNESRGMMDVTPHSAVVVPFDARSLKSSSDAKT